MRRLDTGLIRTTNNTCQFGARVIPVLPAPFGMVATLLVQSGSQPDYVLTLTAVGNDFRTIHRRLNKFLQVREIYPTLEYTWQASQIKKDW